MDTKVSSSDDPAIGIDLGTTNCVVAAFINGKVEIIPNVQYGTHLTPSYVTYGPNVKECYGKVSKDQAHRFPENTVYEVKRIIGRHWNDPVLQKDIKGWPFQLIEVNGAPKIRIGSHARYPQEVCAKLLFEFCRSADKHLGKPPGTIHKAVITVPAYFTEGQRRATIEAGEAAGIKVLTILNEPTAAAIAYKHLRKSSGSKTVLIYDLGGGTFDVAIVKLNENGMETLGVDGDTHLGGSDFDQLLVEHCAAEFKKENKIDLIKGKPGFYRPLSRLRLQCEKAKEALSSFDRTDVDVQSINCGVDLFVSVTREDFETMIRPLLWKTINIVERAIKDAREVKGKDDIDDVILVGGSTRIPLVAQMLGEVFPGKRLTFAIDPDEAVAYGAALQASNLSHSSTSEVSDTAKDEMEEFINEDVTPMSIGVETKGRKFDRVIKKNSKIPCSKSVIYRTVYDNQTIIRIQVFQGENELTTANERLGDFSISVPKGPAGKETVEVCMNIRGDGTLNVTAISRTNGASHSINVEDERLRMDRGAIERLVEELHI